MHILQKKRPLRVFFASIQPSNSYLFLGSSYIGTKNSTPNNLEHLNHGRSPPPMPPSAAGRSPPAPANRTMMPMDALVASGAAASTAAAASRRNNRQQHIGHRHLGYMHFNAIRRLINCKQCNSR